MRKLGQCQIKDCPNKTRYALFRTMHVGSKEWVYVCAKHEAEIGNENLRRSKE